MFVSVLLNIALVLVPFAFYFFCGMLAFSNLVVMLPKFVSRYVMEWPVHSIELTPHEIWFRNFSGDVYCENGDLINPGEATVYLSSKSEKMYHDGTPFGQNSSFVSELSRTFHTVILDCPDFSPKNNSSSTSSSPYLFGEKHDSYLRTVEYVKWIATYNFLQKNSQQPKIKVWLRLSNNALYFEDISCIALALAGNARYPATVQGLTLNSHFYTPLANSKSASNDWEAPTHAWLKLMRRFNLKLGLTLSLPSCTNLRQRVSLAKTLEKFDGIFYNWNSGGAYARDEEGAITILSKKYQVCRSLVATKSPNAATVRNVIPEINVIFRRFNKFGNFCLIYDWRKG